MHIDPGCNDKSLPRKVNPVEIPFSLYFAGESLRWGGGRALIKSATNGKFAKARAYLITFDQFNDIVAQENWPYEVDKVPSINKIRTDGSFIVGKGNYSRVVYCGDLQGYPMFSFTSPVGLTEINKPSAAYLKTIAAGLNEAFGFNGLQSAEYLLDFEGITNNFTLSELAKILENKNSPV